MQILSVFLSKTGIIIIKSANGADNIRYFLEKNGTIRYNIIPEVRVCNSLS